MSALLAKARLMLVSDDPLDFDAWVEMAEALEEEMHGLVGGERRRALLVAARQCSARATAIALAALKSAAQGGA